MSILETNGNEETTRSADKRRLLDIVTMLRIFQRPFKFAHIDVRVCKDLEDGEYYRLTKDKTRFTIELREPDGAIQRIFPELAFAWASMHIWSKLEDGKTKYPVGWGEKVGYCWRIITGEVSEVIDNAVRRQPE